MVAEACVGWPTALGPGRGHDASQENADGHIGDGKERGFGMSNEREHDPSVEDAADAAHGPEIDEHDDTMGQVQSAEWRSSTYRSSRKFDDIARAATKAPRKASSERPDPEDDAEGQSAFRPPVD